jgi:hypothetical protein
MRANEFITESQIPDTAAAPTIPLYHFPNMTASNPYEMYRFGMMLADGTADAEGPIGQDSVVAVYTQAEMDMINKAAKRMGKKGRFPNGMRSEEPAGTQKVSPLKPQGPVVRKS